MTLGAYFIVYQPSYLNSFLAMIHKKRRQCLNLEECLLFVSYEQSNSRITQKYRQGSRYICDEGAKMLQNLTQDYLKSKSKWDVDPPTFQMPVPKPTNDNINFQWKKPLVNSPSQQSSFTELKKFHSFEKSEQKERRGSLVPEKQKRKRLTEGEQLQQSLNKLALEENTENNQDQETENYNILNLEQLKSKNVSQLILESNKKMEERLAQKRLRQGEQHPSSDSSYPITDYSSNQSSNENDYQEELRQQQSQNKQTQLFSTKSLSQSSLASSSYEPMKLMFSPKKSKSKSKRVFIRNKKIPRWAADLDKVNEQVGRQQNNPRFDPNQIYGLCLVQRLDTNVIFNQEDIYHRGSSAKWTRNPFSQFTQ